MNNKIKMDKLLELFKMLRVILVSEGDGNWIRGVDSIIFSLSPKSISTSSDEEAIRYAESTYKAMFRGNGSFSDFYIWRDDFEERVYENEKLDILKDKIWSEFGCK